VPVAVRQDALGRTGAGARLERPAIDSAFVPGADNRVGIAASAWSRA